MVVAVAVTVAKLEKRPGEIEAPIVISEPKTVSQQPPIALFPHVPAIPPTVGQYNIPPSGMPLGTPLGTPLHKQTSSEHAETTRPRQFLIGESSSA